MNVCLAVAARSNNGCVAFHVDPTVEHATCMLYGNGLHELAGWDSLPSTGGSNTIESTNPSPASGTLCYTRSRFASIVSPSTQDCFEQDVDYAYVGTNFDLKRGVLTATGCQEICQAKDQCNHWTWAVKEKQCWEILTAVPEKEKKSGHISGPKFCGQWKCPSGGRYEPRNGDMNHGDVCRGTSDGGWGCPVGCTKTYNSRAPHCTMNRGAGNVKQPCRRTGQLIFVL